MQSELTGQIAFTSQPVFVVDRNAETLRVGMQVLRLALGRVNELRKDSGYGKRLVIAEEEL